MSVLEVAREKWNLLQSIHFLFLFSNTLPSVNGADGGRYGPLRDAPLERLKNEITTLRNDIKLNIVKQKQVDIDQLRDEAGTEELVDELDCLLEMFEGLVDDNILEADDIEPADTKQITDFPKLSCLRALLRTHETVPQSAATQPDDSGLGLRGSNNMPETQMTQIASFIGFPQGPEEIGFCKRVVARFGAAIMKIFEESVGAWNSEAQMQYYTEAEVEIIKDAHAFAAACTSLFDIMAAAVACGNPHHARLHLSGFKREQLEMNISSCEQNQWVSATFTRILDQVPRSACQLGDICSCSTLPSEHEDLPFALNYNCEDDPPGVGNTTSKSAGPLEPTVLSNLLGQRNLKPMHRKLLGVLLACSLLQLYDSPWIQQQWDRDTIYLPERSLNSKMLHGWHPHVLCSLASQSGIKLEGDDIAAFGILLMELEANDTVYWTDEDVEWPSSERSNRVRLARILRDWEDDVGDEYRQVGRSCLEFERLTETFDHYKLESDMKGLAIVYKCILDPLFRCLVNDYGKAARLFQGILGPWGGISGVLNLSSSEVVKRSLFDDLETTMEDERVGYATRFLESLQPHFDSILRLGMAKPGLAAIRATRPGREKIRIAILDSGIDEKDPKIRGAISSLRIKKRASFLEQSDDCQDTYGHGTHVAKLLLQTAPAAEIYIAKICHGKLINQEFMPGIAKAVDWAVEEIDAHIISMSFGFEDANDPVDAAVERAIQRGKLIFAAASNNGGLSGRARPARSDDVMCIHASDGLGNKGDMNPSPIPDASNFATLGVAVPLKWKGKIVCKSGTSFATPIAAGFAANVLEFANRKCSLPPSRRKLLYKRRGMQVIFRQMSVRRDEYDFVHPGRLWKDGLSEQDVARTIEDIVRAL